MKHIPALILTLLLISPTVVFAQTETPAKGEVIADKAAVKADRAKLHADKEKLHADRKELREQRREKMKEHHAQHQTDKTAQ